MMDVKFVGQLNYAENGGVINVYTDNYTRIPSSLSNIPPAINLIGREKDIQAIYDLLEQHSVVSIHADGGVGKTAVAAKIANEIKSEIVSGQSPYEHIAWITSTGNLQEDLTCLDIPPVRSAGTPDEKHLALRLFLENTPTFLIIDNMDEPPTFDEEELINTISGKTRILITTRAVIPVSKKYDLGELDPEAALVLFYGHYKRITDFSIEKIKMLNDVSFAKVIVDAAFYNTLFIELIGKMAYSDHKKLDELWDKLKDDVFGQDSKHEVSTGHGKSHPKNKGKLLTQIQKLYEMSNISYRQKEIMSFIALFPAEHSIFFDVFNWAGFEEDEEDNLGALQDRGWIERNDEGYLIHTLVKGSVELQTGKTAFDENIYEKLINELGDTDQYMPKDMAYTCVRERIVVPETVCRLLIDNGSEKESTGKLYNNIATVYRTHFKNEEALDYYDKALKISQRIHGEEHSITASTYNNIALLYRDQGKYEEALKNIYKALKISQKVLGEEHPHMVMMYNTVATVYHSLGKYEEALEYYEKALKIREKVLGKEHPLTGTIYHNIALTYSIQGNYREALEYYEKALKIREKALGEEHPDTASTYNNIANLYSFLSKNEKALEYFEKTLKIREKVLGKEHPDTASTYNNLAIVYRSQGRYKEALEYFEKALKISEKMLGEEHLDTAMTYNNIANVYSNQGKNEEALEYYEKALKIREKVLGEEHPNTASTYNNIAAVFHSQGKKEEALKYFEKALKTREKVLGEEHPDTASSYNNIAILYRSQGKNEEALEYYEKALIIKEKVLGKEHPSTASTYNNIAILYRSQGRYEEALEYFEKALKIRERVLGEEHSDTATTYNNIAILYRSQGKYEKALKYYEKALKIREKVLGKDHPYTKKTSENMEVIKKKIRVII